MSKEAFEESQMENCGYCGGTGYYELVHPAKVEAGKVIDEWIEEIKCICQDEKYIDTEAGE